MKSLLIGLLLLSGTWASAQTNVLTVYTDRPTDRVMKAAGDFATSRGLTLQVVEMPFPALLERLLNEGEQSPADVVFTKDIVYFNELKQNKLLQPMDTTSVRSLVSPSMVDKDNQWTAVTFRARTAVYNPDIVSKEELSTYEDLASPKWQGRLCLRTSKGSYNEALSAFLVTAYGEDQAKKILEGYVNNLAMAPFKNDTALINAIATGDCHVGIINTYYLGIEKSSNPHLPAEIFFLNQDSKGVHTNGSGVGILKTASDKALAQAFIEQLLSAPAQQFLADSHFEFPANTNVRPSTLVQHWMPFKMSPLNWADIGLNVETGKKLIVETNYP